MKIVHLMVLGGIAFGLMQPLDARADQTVPPPRGENWGDEHAGEKMLQMTRDPEAPSSDTTRTGDYHVPRHCKDQKGHFHTENETGYEDCLKEQSQRRVPTPGTAGGQASGPASPATGNRHGNATTAGTH